MILMNVWMNGESTLGYMNGTCVGVELFAAKKTMVLGEKSV
jgi:hypothetical protein